MRVDDLVWQKQTLTGFSSRFIVRVKEDVLHTKAGKRGESDWNFMLKEFPTDQFTAKAGLATIPCSVKGHTAIACWLPRLIDLSMQPDMVHLELIPACIARIPDGR